jgi:hypothetical protein
MGISIFLPDCLGSPRTFLKPTKAEPRGREVGSSSSGA